MAWDRDRAPIAELEKNKFRGNLLEAISVSVVNPDGTNVSIPAGNITINYPSNYTSFATIYSAAGNATLFTPPASQRWVLKDLIITALGRNEVAIKSGANDIIPFAGLATTGGYIGNFGDSGLRAKALNDAFVVNLNSLATISVMANVRFDTV